MPPGFGPAASRLAEGAMLPALPVGLAVPAIIALGVIDRHRENQLPHDRRGNMAGHIFL